MGTTRRTLIASGLAASVTMPGLATIAKASIAAEPAGSNATWPQFAARIADFQSELASLGNPKRDVDVAEGYRIYSRYLSCAFEQCLENVDPAHPVFYRLTRDGYRKFAGDNPDEIYDTAKISPQHEYIVSGTMKDTLLIEIGIYSGDGFLTPGLAVKLLNSLTEEGLHLNGDGSFELVVGGAARAANWLPLAPGATTLLIRRYMKNASQTIGRPFAIERQGAPIPLEQASTADILARLNDSARWTSYNVKLWATFVDSTRAKHFNQLVEVNHGGNDGTPAGHAYLEGYWSIKPDEAILVSLEPPRAVYWNFLIMNYWMESLEWRFGNKSCYNNFEAKTAADGRVIFAISPDQPKRRDVNWVETLGHTEGPMALRAARAKGPFPIAEVQVVKRDAI